MKIAIRNSSPEEELRIESILSGLSLSKNEIPDRLLIQGAIDKHGIEGSILYNGNLVWGKNRIVEEYKKIKKRGQLEGMSDHFYNFLHLACGSIAHYNKESWIFHYDNSVEELEAFFRCNEYGRNIFDHAGRFSDQRSIAKELLELAESHSKGER